MYVMTVILCKYNRQMQVGFVYWKKKRVSGVDTARETAIFQASHSLKEGNISIYILSSSDKIGLVLITPKKCDKSEVIVSWI